MIRRNSPSGLRTAKRKIQLGVGLAMGLFSNMIAGDMAMEIHVCAECRKMEFYCDGDVSRRFDGESAEMPQKVCPGCGDVHDFDFPKCPACNRLYE